MHIGTVNEEQAERLQPSPGSTRNSDDPTHCRSWWRLGIRPAVSS